MLLRTILYAVQSITRKQGTSWILPGLASVHSHAFQRELRGKTQRKTVDSGDFWSWRSRMYDLVASLDPDRMYALSLAAYCEMRQAGVTLVGEFHYVHHDPNGRPYAERTVMGDAVIRAARDAGLRIALLRVIYERDSASSKLLPAQRRFVDRNIEDAFRDIESLSARYKDDSCVRVGIAPHSVRAVRRDGLLQVAEYLRHNPLPIHMHISEQERDVQECIAEHGVPPVQLLAELGLLSSNFVAVHATHLSQVEIEALASANAFVCICRTTERDLGDGLPPLSEFQQAGIRICFGIDSHAYCCPFEEARACELDERSRLKHRHAAFNGSELLVASSEHGYAALGFAGLHLHDQVQLNANDPTFQSLANAEVDDLVVFCAHPRCVITAEIDAT